MSGGPVVAGGDVGVVHTPGGLAGGWFAAGWPPDCCDSIVTSSANKSVGGLGHEAFRSDRNGWLCIRDELGDEFSSSVGVVG